MPKLIPIALAEAALEAQSKEYKMSLPCVSKATFDEVWMLYQQALEQVAYIKADNERLAHRLASADAILKVYFSPTLKINQYTKSRNG